MSRINSQTHESAGMAQPYPDTRGVSQQTHGPCECIAPHTVRIGLQNVPVQSSSRRSGTSSRSRSTCGTSRSLRASLF